MMNKQTKKIEFSKKLVTWALIMTSVSICVSYLLAFLGRDPCVEITVSVATACIAIAVGYEAKSFGEKNSRNKYGVCVSECECGTPDDGAKPVG